MNPNNILISGGAGFIGSRLAMALAAQGHRVTVLDSLSPQIHGTATAAGMAARFGEAAEFVQADVRDRDAWRRLVEGKDAVVHLAAETGTGQSMYRIGHYTDVNLNGTAALLDVLANEKHAVRRVVVASSRAIYGEGRYQCARCGIVYPASRSVDRMQSGRFEPQCPCCGADVAPLPTAEDSKLHPSSVYGITKLGQEQLVLEAGRALGLEAVALRYQNVYGPGQSLANPYTGILSIFSTRILNGNPINIFEDGRESRDFVYIDDVVAATVLALEHAGAPGEAFNVGAGEGTDVLTVARTLVGAYGREVPIAVSGNFRAGDIRHNIADLGKARERLGWRPSVSFAEGIRRFTEWVKGESVQADDYDRSIGEMAARGLFR